MKIRNLAKLRDKLNSLSPSIDNVAEIMSRRMFSVVSGSDDWNQFVNIHLHNECINELIV